MQTPEEIRKILAAYYCTQEYHYVDFSKAAGVYYTDGVKAMLRRCEAYWLLELICLYQPLCRRDESLCYMQFWTLRVNTIEGTAVLICERDTGDLAIQHGIEYTDFPLDEIKVWLEVGVVGDEQALVAMLPGER